MASRKRKPKAPTAFITYSWDDEAHKEWVRQLAMRLRKDGVDVTLDRWHAAPGDQIPLFMERAVRDNDFVIAVCTPRFKKRSDGRGGGVGYEGDIITAYAFTGATEKKFIPVLRRGTWSEAAPTWLLGRAMIDLSEDPYSESEYDELLRTLHGAREAAPPIGGRPNFEEKKRPKAGPSRATITPPSVRTAPEDPTQIMPEPTIGILTALEHEFVAVKHMLQAPRDYHATGESVRYVLGRIPGAEGRDHPVALALGDTGETLAGIHTTRLKSQFPNLDFLLMVGIAGGIPNPTKAVDHVRLGDIVVSDKYGVVQFDFGKLTTSGYQYRSAPRPPSAKLLASARHLRARELEGQRPWEVHLERALKALKWVRPPVKKDFLGDPADPKKRIAHPKDPQRVPGQPRVFFGLIASSNTVLKDPVKRDELRDRFGARAVEMETAGLADAAWILEIGYLGVRGICDYCDANKNDDWQQYAAAAAAAYVRALFESIPGTIPALSPEEAVTANEPTALVPSPNTRRSPMGAAGPRAKATAHRARSLESAVPADDPAALTPSPKTRPSPKGPAKPAVKLPASHIDPEDAEPTRSVKSRSRKARAGTDSSDGARARAEDRRRAYRDRIRSELEEKLGSLGRVESHSPRLLDRVATVLAIKNPPRDEGRLREAIAGHLLDVKDAQAIPRLNKLYIELWKEGKERPADLIADCIDLLFPLYFSWDAIDLAIRQLEHRTFVVIEGAVSSMPGADAVLAVHDGASTCFVPHANGPRGKHAIRMDTPPIDAPSLEHDVCQILDQILRQIGLTPDVRGTDGVRGDTAARARRLSRDLNGILGGYKIQHGRSLYCVVQKPESEEDREYGLKVLRRLRELVPNLVLIELDPDAPARHTESAIGYCLLLRYRESQKRLSS
jgi:nucleoside phosphorylase